MVISYTSFENRAEKILSPTHWVAIFLGLMAFAFILYIGSYKYGYVLDDDAVFGKNRYTQQGFSGIPDILSHSYFAGYNRNFKLTYRPLSVVSFAIEKQLFGNSPSIGHLINIFLYGITGSIIFTWLYLLLRKKSVLIPLVTSLLFLAHPIHTEVVANIKSRDELMATLFILLSLIFLKRPIWSGFFFCMALFSKESTITFLAIAPLCLYFFSQNSLRKSIKSCLCLLPGFFFYMTFRYEILGSFSGEDTVLQENIFRQASSSSESLATGISLIAKSLGLLIFPRKLFYDYSSLQQIPLVDFNSIIVWIVLGALIYFIFKCVKNFRDKNFFYFTILFGLISYSITSNIFILTGVTFAERHLYIPSIAFCLFIALLFQKFLGEKPKIIITLTILLLLFGIWKTHDRLPDWQSNETLFNKDYNKAPSNPRIVRDYCRIQIDTALKDPDTKNRRNLFTKTINILKKRLTVSPQDTRSKVLLGIAYFHNGENDNAIEILKEKKVRQKPRGQQFFKFAMATRRMNEGKALKEKKQYEEAILLFEVVIRNLPDFSEAYHELGLCYEALLEHEKAAEMFRKRDTFGFHPPLKP